MFYKKEQDQLPLLNEKGEAVFTGRSFSMDWFYNKEYGLFQKGRIREWDGYEIFTQEFGLRLKMMDLGHSWIAKISIADYANGKTFERTAFSMNRLGRSLPLKPDHLQSEMKVKNLVVRFERSFHGHHIVAEVPHTKGQATFKADIWLEEDQKQTENIAYAYENKRHYFLFQSNPHWHCSGKIIFNHKIYHLDPKNDLAISQYFRGFLPVKTSATYLNAAQMIKGKEFSLALQEEAFQNKGLFEVFGSYHKKAEFLKNASIEYDEKSKQWKIFNENGSLQAIFISKFETKNNVSFGPFKNIETTLWGTISGQINIEGKIVTFSECKANLVHTQTSW